MTRSPELQDFPATDQAIRASATTAGPGADDKATRWRLEQVKEANANG